MVRARSKFPQISDDDVRRIMLEYFFRRNKGATSRKGKRSGAAAIISVIRADLKASHGLTIQQVQSNLTYLLSQEWVEDQAVMKSYTTAAGGVIPSTTSYYIITAAGIDKIDGPSDFTRDRFEGIKIEATGQNIITLGDGNQVNARFRETGEALSELRERIKASEVDDTTKLDLIVDIDSLQAQLAKPIPNKDVVNNLWSGIQRVASLAGLGTAVAQVAPHVASVLSS